MLIKTAFIVIQSFLGTSSINSISQYGGTLWYGGSLACNQSLLKWHCTDLIVIQVTHNLSNTSEEMLIFCSHCTFTVFL